MGSRSQPGLGALYEREGFTYDHRKGLGNCVMVRFEDAARAADQLESPGISNR